MSTDERGSLESSKLFRPERAADILSALDLLLEADIINSRRMADVEVDINAHSHLCNSEADSFPHLADVLTTILLDGYVV